MLVIQSVGIKSPPHLLIIVNIAACHGLFSPVLLLNQGRCPPLRLPVPYCSIVSIMCDVPSTAVVCSDSVECFRRMASRFSLKHFVTIPVAPVTAYIVVHFMSHIRCTCISVQELLYSGFVSAPFCVTFLSVVGLL
jgi:hypothetical protein